MSAKPADSDVVCAHSNPNLDQERQALTRHILEPLQPLGVSVWGKIRSGFGLGRVCLCRKRENPVRTCLVLRYI